MNTKYKEIFNQITEGKLEDDNYTRNYYYRNEKGKFLWYINTRNRIHIIKFEKGHVVNEKGKKLSTWHNITDYLLSDDTTLINPLVLFESKSYEESIERFNKMENKFK